MLGNRICKCFHLIINRRSISGISRKSTETTYAGDRSARLKTLATMQFLAQFGPTHEARWLVDPVWWAGFFSLSTSRGRGFRTSCPKMAQTTGLTDADASAAERLIPMWIERVCFFAESFNTESELFDNNNNFKLHLNSTRSKPVSWSCVQIKQQCLLVRHLECQCAIAAEEKSKGMFLILPTHLHFIYVLCTYTNI